MLLCGRAPLQDIGLGFVRTGGSSCKHNEQAEATVAYALARLGRSREEGHNGRAKTYSLQDVRSSADGEEALFQPQVSAAEVVVRDSPRNSLPENPLGPRLGPITMRAGSGMLPPTPDSTPDFEGRPHGAADVTPLAYDCSISSLLLSLGLFPRGCDSPRCSRASQAGTYHKPSALDILACDVRFGARIFVAYLLALPPSIANNTRTLSQQGGHKQSASVTLAETHQTLVLGNSEGPPPLGHLAP